MSMPSGLLIVDAIFATCLVAATPTLLYQVRVLPAAWVEAAYFVLTAVLVVVLVKTCRPSRAAA